MLPRKIGILFADRFSGKKESAERVKGEKQSSVQRHLKSPKAKNPEVDGRYERLRNGRLSRTEGTVVDLARVAGR